jgi:hypothetical protein
MADAKDRALARLTEILTPMAALGVECPTCSAAVAVRCTWFVKNMPSPTEPPFHAERYAVAREAVRLDLKTLTLD